MNMASTRSHCIFTIHISAREPGADLIRKAKLHLVDLAGSERVGKTGVGGTLLMEAKFINSSLHFLEQVELPYIVFCEGHVLVERGRASVYANHCSACGEVCTL